LNEISITGTVISIPKNKTQHSMVTVNLQYASL